MTTRHALRILALLAVGAVILGWVVKHSVPERRVGLRAIGQAEQIARGDWHGGLVGGIDHALHPLSIAAAHHLVGGDGPSSWQRAALFVCLASTVLLVIPIYLLALELFGERPAWLACILVIINPVAASNVVNVLDQTTFLLWWAFGLWSAVRFLREGRFRWLAPVLAFGALAYLARPEGLLVPGVLGTSLLLLPVLRMARIHWPRYWRAVALVTAGALFLIGPYIMLKGGIGTKPAIARVLGLADQADPLALEREAPVSLEQSTLETYRTATVRMTDAFVGAVTLQLLPFALFGLLLALRSTDRTRAWLFLGVVLAVSALALVRLHAVGGYCTPTHALPAGLILLVAAAAGLARLLDAAWLPGRWFGLAHERLRPGPAVWAMVVCLLCAVPVLGSLGPHSPGPFSVYYQTGDWLAENTKAEEQVLDLTDWSLFFSRRTGYGFAELYQAPADPRARWIVARRRDVEGTRPYCQFVRELIGGRMPVAILPADAGAHQLQIRIYDRLAPAPTPASSAIAAAGGSDEPVRRR
jgi:Dolichyl-phosphate-mannose-protein mannosyltransferase